MQFDFSVFLKFTDIMTLYIFLFFLLFSALCWFILDYQVIKKMKVSPFRLRHSVVVVL